MAFPVAHQLHHLQTFVYVYPSRPLSVIAVDSDCSSLKEHL
ncbi:hypothetical protein O6H91_03G102100 [Diphasiastrum complanatum]|uniref:Uncharacterized protein n=1 Tax=Diphasiastrum complanatum TaxID=34168 RepID=A0ACC2E9R0_DIPCM|nr:hypothetical protein O6H91_03G102100 [Diphasiastrum complanatum]